MLPFDRREEIIDYLKKQKSASIEDLSKTLFISPSTIRRDLTILQKEGFVRRTRGGAILIEKTLVELPFTLRNSDNHDKKSYISDLAMAYIKDDDTIFLDSGTTVMYMAKKLKTFHNLKVITNNPLTAQYLSENTDIDTFCVGGHLFQKSSSIQGPAACKFISQFHADIAFLSCRGLSSDFGPSDFTEEAAEIKYHFSKHATKTILLIDSSKFQKTYVHSSLELSMIDAVVSDALMPEELEATLLQHNIEIVY